MYFEIKHGDPLFLCFITHSQREAAEAEAEAAEAETDANYLRIRKQYKSSAYNQQSRPISHIVWTD